MGYFRKRRWRWLLAAVAMGVMLFSLHHPFPTVGIDGEATEPGAGANRGGGAGGGGGGGGRWISVQQLEKKLKPNPPGASSPPHKNGRVPLQDAAFSAFGLYVDPILNPSGCSPAKKIGLMKTHKTGSSTIQNILLRYAYHFDLNVFFPDKDEFRDPPWKDEFESRRLYDVHAVHHKWSKNFVLSHLGDDAKLFSVLRDPTDAFESLFSYYDLANFTEVDSLHGFVEKLRSGEVSREERYRNKGLNNMIFDMGLGRNKKPEELSNMSAVEEKVAKLNSDFDLVLISELMDESLVLLSHLLCFPLHWMAVFQKNVRKEETKEPIAQEDRDTLREFQQADEYMYKFFRAKLEEKIDGFGRERMQKSVGELKRLRSSVESTCILGRASNSEAEGTAFHVVSDKTAVFRVREDVEECAMMAYGQGGFFELLYQGQLDRFRKMMEA